MFFNVVKRFLLKELEKLFSIDHLDFILHSEYDDSLENVLKLDFDLLAQHGRVSVILIDFLDSTEHSRLTHNFNHGFTLNFSVPLQENVKNDVSKIFRELL